MLHHIILLEDNHKLGKPRNRQLLFGKVLWLNKEEKHSKKAKTSSSKVWQVIIPVSLSLIALSYPALCFWNHHTSDIFVRKYVGLMAVLAEDVLKITFHWCLCLLAFKDSKSHKHPRGKDSFLHSCTSKEIDFNWIVIIKAFWILYSLYVNFITIKIQQMF